MQGHTRQDRISMVARAPRSLNRSRQSGTGFLAGRYRLTLEELRVLSGSERSDSRQCPGMAVVRAKRRKRRRSSSGT